MKIDFVGIGPGKAGTTWIYSVLKKHPRISMCKVKETNYFNEDYSRGESWYHSLFQDHQKELLKGEVSNTYIFSPEAAERLHAYNSSVKLFSVLRDPIERAVSHYYFLIRNGASYKSFEEAVEQRPDLLSRGLYSKHLKPYGIRFPKEQLFIGLFDRMKAHPQDFADELFSFLDVDSITLVSSEGNQFSASKPRLRLIAKITKFVALMVRRLGHPVIVERVKRSLLVKWLYKKTSYDVEETCGDKLADYLAYYSDDVSELSAILGIDLDYLWFGKYRT